MSDAHVSWRRLADRRDGRLSARRAAEAEAHLATGCASCAAAAREIGRLVAAIAAGAPEAPPRVEETAAIRLFRDVQSAFTREARRVLGVLLTDRADGLVAGLRAAPGAVRRLLWRVGPYDVDAGVVARPGGADVLGQILPRDDDASPIEEGEVVVRDRRGVRARARVGPDGRFTFRGLPRGVHAFEGQVGALRFVLPPVVVE